jgi:hypothetical protein
MRSSAANVYGDVRDPDFLIGIDTRGSMESQDLNLRLRVGETGHIRRRTAA